MSIWDDIRNKGKEVAAETINSAIPSITEKIGEVIKGTLEKKDNKKKK